MKPAIRILSASGLMPGDQLELVHRKVRQLFHAVRARSHERCITLFYKQQSRGCPVAEHAPGVMCAPFTG